MEKEKTEVKSVSTETERNNSFWIGYRCTIYIMLNLKDFSKIRWKKAEDSFPECENKKLRATV